MKLTALDQIHISSVQRDPIAPGQTFEVSDDMGKQLLEKHPSLFDQAKGSKAAPASPANADDEPNFPDAKSESAPQNKAEDAPANKADTRRDAKSK